LRAEVESLLARVVPESFFDGPVVEVAARLLASERREPELTSIGPYQVVKPLGAGGWQHDLARDPRLNRPVAVKLLSPMAALKQNEANGFARKHLPPRHSTIQTFSLIHEIGGF
jgi:hypothetical protein